MLAYAALISSSPLLLEQNNGALTKALTAVRRELQNRSIKKLLILRGEADVERQGILAMQVHPKLQITLKDLGNLSIDEDAPFWWDAYHRLMPKLGSLAEPIDYPHIGYQTSLVLHALFPEGLNQTSILPLHLTGFPDQKQSQIITESIKEELANEPYALLLPISFGFSDQKKKQHFLAYCHALREQILHMQSLADHPSEPETIPPDFFAAYELLIELIKNECLYQELYWDMQETPLLIGQYVRK